MESPQVENVERIDIMRPKTIFCDIDGTLVEHMSPSESTRLDAKMKVLPGSLEKLLEWERKGYKIILTTGRQKCATRQTERQLAEAGIIYDELIMGLGGGQRILINDLKQDKNSKENPTAISINLERNKGINAIDL
jgi:hydroxymethylpyrimidine pyrophosphatase-like HAD family hydrolase